MSATMKNENEVFKILRESSLAGLEYVLGKNNGVEVMRFAQASFTYSDNLILLNHILTDREGWQAVHYEQLLGAEKRTDEWIENQHWQFTALKRMRQEDTTSTLAADDLANALILWFNGKGVYDLKSRGVSNLLIDPHEIFVYNDDSNLYQRRIVFTMKVLVPKEFSGSVDTVGALEWETHPV